MTHSELVTIAAAWLKRHGCYGVLTERGQRSGEIPDAIGWKTTFNGEHLDTYAVVIEAKVSRSDFLADRSKAHRQLPHALGRRRYFLAPKGLLSLSDIPERWGLLEWTGRIVRFRRPATEEPMTQSSVERERDLLLKELRAFHAQGLDYKKGAERWGRPA